MLRVKTKVKSSGVEGLGLFADQFIPKGTVTWEYDPEFDSSFTKEQIEKLPEMAKAWFMTYVYFDFEQNKYILCSDNQRHINHSETPNIQSTPNQDVAGKDILAGEEMTCDYSEYERDWFERRGVAREEFSIKN